MFFVNDNPIKVIKPFKIKSAKPKSKLKYFRHKKLIKNVIIGDKTQIIGANLSLTLILVNNPKAYKPNNGP